MAEIDTLRLQAFENQLDTQHPESGKIPSQVLGYGEISAVLKIDGIPEIAFKRLPPFDTEREREVYQQGVEQYCQALKDRLGINVLSFAFYPLRNIRGEHILYLAQPCLDSSGFGNNIIAHQSSEQSCQLIAPLIDLFLKLSSDSSENSKIGIDGQLSNWHFNLDQPETPPSYIDISTPFLRIQGQETLDPKLFLKAVPKLMRAVVKYLFLQEVIDRYYDMRMVMIDLLANLHKEQQAAKIDPFIAMINQKITDQKSEMKPICRQEVDRYYKNDARIWRLFLSLRRLDRFVTTKLFGKHYNFVLPGKIQR